MSPDSPHVAGSRGRLALQALNFFMADMQAGVGPFLGVFLLAHGWQSGWIGSVMTIGAVAGVLTALPTGAWVDAATYLGAMALGSLGIWVASASIIRPERSHNRREPTSTG